MSDPRRRGVHNRLKRQADTLENLASESTTRSSFSLNTAEEQELRELVTFLRGHLDKLRLTNIRSQLNDVESILYRLKDDLKVRRDNERPTRLIEAMVWEAENERSRILASLSQIVGTSSWDIPGHPLLEPPPTPSSRISVEQDHHLAHISFDPSAYSSSHTLAQSILRSFQAELDASQANDLSRFWELDNDLEIEAADLHDDELDDLEDLDSAEPDEVELVDDLDDVESEDADFHDDELDDLEDLDSAELDEVELVDDLDDIEIEDEDLHDDELEDLEDLDSAELDEAELDDDELKDGELDEVDLIDDLDDIEIKDADLHDDELEDLEDLDSAELDDDELKDGELDEVELVDDLDDIEIEDEDLHDDEFEDLEDLDSAELVDDLDDVEIKDADLHDDELEDLEDLDSAELDEAELDEVELDDDELVDDLDSAELDEVELHDDELKDGELDELELDDDDLEDIELDEVELDDDELVDDLDDVEIEDEDLHGDELDDLEDLDSAELDEVELHDDELKDGELDELELDDDELKDVELDELELDDDELKDVELDELELDNDDLEDVKLDEPSREDSIKPHDLTDIVLEGADPLNAQDPLIQEQELGAPTLEGNLDELFSGPPPSVLDDTFFQGASPPSKAVAEEPEASTESYLDDLTPEPDDDEPEEQLAPPSKEYKSSILEALRQVKKRDDASTRADVLSALEATVPKEYQAAVSERRRLVRLPGNYDVNCYQGNQIFHATVRDISLGGMKIEATRQLQVGSELQVANPHSRSNELDERITAQVRWFRAKDNLAEVGLQFVDPPEVLGRSWVVSLLNKVGMQSQVFNQRKFTRASAYFDMDIVDDSGNSYPAYCIDLGLGGALIDTHESFEINEWVTFSCQSFGAHGKLEARAKIVAIKEQESDAHRYAIEFDHLDASTTKLLGRYVVDLLKLGRGPRSR